MNIDRQRFKTASKYRRSRRLESLLKPRKIFKIISIVVLSSLALILITYWAINLSYSTRIIYSQNEIPQELRSSVIIASNIDTDREEYSRILRINRELFLSRRIDSLIIFNLDQSRDLDQLISENLNGVDQTKIRVENVYNNLENVCRDDEKLLSNKGIVFTTGDKILRSLYLCNYFQLYYTGFKIESSESVGQVTFVSMSEFLKDLLILLQFRNIGE